MRADAHATLLPERDLHHATLIFVTISTSQSTVVEIGVKMVELRQRSLALARLLRILMVRWATRNGSYYSE